MSNPNRPLNHRPDPVILPGLHQVIDINTRGIIRPPYQTVDFIPHGLVDVLHHLFAVGVVALADNHFIYAGQVWL
ncbi:MAG: hypothetical protein PHG14_06680 [Desulfobacter postgatei]|uniref:hypothetical protein n=1 Tax=Desulfobacter postgatei TaxID=2293 RepID=UPI0023F141E9|nr:hypothetical protein [Desulfobacter postgatei]MDD4273396.1 hypothetical protein [Desulfobacter postgatei]